MVNLKVLFSLGAGVDHILKLSNYNGTPIIRLKDQLLSERMTNHVLSQILNYQLNLDVYRINQNKKKWISEIEPVLNNSLQIGILGFGNLGTDIGKNLSYLGYNILGFKRTQNYKNFPFPVYHKKKDLNKFIKDSDIIVNILPLTNETQNFINKNFLKKMKKKCLLINVGRGSTIDEDDLIQHLENNPQFYAYLDVFKKEPLSNHSKLWKLSNVNITPHIASITEIKSAVDYIYTQYQKFKNTKNIRGNVNIKKGY